MSKSIKLSPKHGVNPMLTKCFFCGGEKNEIAMLGKLPKDAEAPRSGWIPGDYDPCDKCKSLWEQGICLIECSETPTFDNQPPLGTDAYPTGRYVVLKEKALEHIFNEETVEKLQNGRRGMMTPDVFAHLLDIVGKGGNNDD